MFRFGRFDRPTLFRLLRFCLHAFLYCFSYFVSRFNSLVRRLVDGIIGFRHDAASLAGGVLGPETLGELRAVLVAELVRVEGAPVLVARDGNALGLGRTVGPGAGLGQVLLVVGLTEVPDSAVLVVVRTGGDLRRDGLVAQGLLVGALGGLDQGLLLVVEVVESRSVLGPAVVALSHSGAGIVGLPEPPQDVHKADLGRIVDDPDALRVPRAATAGLLVGGVGAEAGAVSDGRAVDSPEGQPPDSLFASPEAAVGKDSDLESLGYLLELVAQDGVAEALDVGHLLVASLQRFGRGDQGLVAAAHQVQDVSDHASLGR